LPAQSLRMQQSEGPLDWHDIEWQDGDLTRPMAHYPCPFDTAARPVQRQDSINAAIVGLAGAGSGAEACSCDKLKCLAQKYAKSAIDTHNTRAARKPSWKGMPHLAYSGEQYRELVAGLQAQIKLLLGDDAHSNSCVCSTTVPCYCRFGNIKVSECEVTHKQAPRILLGPCHIPVVLPGPGTVVSNIEIGSPDVNRSEGNMCDAEMAAVAEFMMSDAFPVDLRLHGNYRVVDGKCVVQQPSAGASDSAATATPHAGPKERPAAALTGATLEGGSPSGTPQRLSQMSIASFFK
jgi:hypothetical protein